MDSVSDSGAGEGEGGAVSESARAKLQRNLLGALALLLIDRWGDGDEEGACAAQTVLSTQQHAALYIMHGGKCASPVGLHTASLWLA